MIALNALLVVLMQDVHDVYLNLAVIAQDMKF